VEYPAIDLYDLSIPPVAVVPGAVPFDQLANELLANNGPGLAAKGTLVKLRGVLDELRALGVQTTDQLSVVLVSRYVQSRPESNAPQTLKSMLSIVRTICSYAEACGYTKTSPFKIKKFSRWVKVPPPAVDEKLHLSRDEIRRILEVMKQDIAERTEWAQWRARRILAATAIVAYTALRRDEMLRLHVVDVDPGGRIIHVVPRLKLKTSAAAAPVPMPEALVPILEDWNAHRLDGPPGALPPRCVWLLPGLTRKNYWHGGSPGYRPLDALQDAARRAGVPDVTFQAFRRSWATHAEFFGMGPALIQRVLRHTSERTSERWYRKADIPNLIERTRDITF
jgi:integrase